MVMETSNAMIHWSNNIVFDGSQPLYFFIKLNWFYCKRANYAVFSFLKTLRAAKLKLKLTATTFPLLQR